MAKIKDELLYDNQYDRVIHKQTFDDTAEMDRIDQIKKTHGVNEFGSDYKLVGSIPAHLIPLWCKEAGVDMSDAHAVSEVMKKKLMSGEFDKLRIWKGKY
jgi:hypothetical protein